MNSVCFIAYLGKIYLFIFLSFFGIIVNCFISDVDVLVIMVTNETQAESVLYGDLGAVSGIS